MSRVRPYLGLGLLAGLGLSLPPVLPLEAAEVVGPVVEARATRESLPVLVAVTGAFGALAVEDEDKVVSASQASMMFRLPGSPGAGTQAGGSRTRTRSSALPRFGLGAVGGVEPCPHPSLEGV
ncbi:MAG: hypothetical protein D6684_11270 [Deinococcus-Thermus bacterium]|nr:MAG: hypothetical protein D6684_11270 [Deinococcota bacterium]